MYLTHFLLNYNRLQCEDFRSKCHKYINVLDLGFNEIGLVAPLCKEAESCSCEAAGDHDVEFVDGGGAKLLVCIMSASATFGHVYAKIQE